MKLSSPLPEGIYCKDKFYKMNTDFKTWLKIDELIQSDITNETEKLALILALAYENKLPDNISDAISGVLNFYSEYKMQKNDSNKKVYSFEKDAAFIFSAFYSKYNIDLFETNMHWWKFRALLNGLDETTLFGRIVRYRCADLNEISDRKQKRYIKKMKHIYSLGEQENIANALFSV